MSKLDADGASRLILDLRGNDGGVLDGALGIAGFFIDKPREPPPLPWPLPCIAT